MSTPQPQKDARLKPASFPFASSLPNWTNFTVVEFYVEGTKVTAVGIPTEDGSAYHLLEGAHTPIPCTMGFTARLVAQVSAEDVQVKRKATRRLFRSLFHAIGSVTKAPEKEGVETL